MIRGISGKIIKNQIMESFVKEIIMLELCPIDISEAMRMLRQRSNRIRFRFERKYTVNPE